MMRGLKTVFVAALKEGLQWVVEQFVAGVRQGYRDLTAELFGTPTPETSAPFVFGTPTNPPWPAIREATVGGEVMVLALLVLLLSVQLRHALRIFNLGGAYQARRASRSAWVGAFYIVGWYWLAVLVLGMVEALTLALVPALRFDPNIAAGMAIPMISNPGLGLILSVLGILSLVGLELLLYIRHVLLFGYLYAMPLGIALAYGNLPVVSDMAMGLCRRFVPLALLPIPAMLVFKSFDLVYAETALQPTTLFLKYTVTMLLPLVALLACWSLFKYSAPLSAKVIGTTAKTTAVVGLIAAGAAAGGAGVATTAGIRGSRAAAGHVVAERVAGRFGPDSTTTQSSEERLPTYRRTENHVEDTSSTSRS